MATAIKKFEGTIGSTGGTTNAFDGGLIADSVYDNVSKNLQGFDRYIASANINSDGTRIYILDVPNGSQFGSTTDTYIGYFTLDTAYDASTLTDYTRVIETNTLPDFTGSPTGFDMTPDGTKFIINTTDDFFYYGLSTAYDFTTIGSSYLAKRTFSQGASNTDVCSGASRVKCKLTNANSSYTGVAIVSSGSGDDKFSQKYFNTNASGGSFSTWGNLGYMDNSFQSKGIVSSASYFRGYFPDFAVGDFDGYSNFGATLFYFMGTGSDGVTDNICYFYCPSGNPGSGTILSESDFNNYSSQGLGYTSYPISGMFVAQNKLYVGVRESNFYEFDFATGADSGTSGVTVSNDTNFIINSGQGAANDHTEFRFNDDGTRFYSNQNSTITYYDLTTAYDLTTRGSAQTCSISAIGGNVAAFTFNREGTRLYVIGYSSTNQYMYQFTLSTAWDLPSSLSGSSATANANLYGLSSTYFRYINSVECDDAERIFFFHPSADSSYSASMLKAGCSTAGDIANLGSFTEISLGYNMANVCFLPSKSMIIGIAYGSDSGHMIRSSCTNMDVVATSSRSTVADITETFVQSDYMNGSSDLGWAVHFDPRGEVFVVTSDSSANDNAYFSTVTAGTVGFPAVTDQSVTTYDFAPFYRYNQSYSVKVDNSGSGLYIVGNIKTYAVAQYVMSTPYDLSTAAVDPGKKILLGASGSKHIDFNNDGTKLYISVSSTLREYTLSTAYDISSASTSYNTLTLPGSFGALTFNSSGSKLYTTSGSSVYQYNMSTAFDISTASSAGSVTQNNYNGGVSLGSLYACIISSDDSRMFFVTSDTVRTMYMPQPGEITSLQYSGDFFGIGGQAADPRGFDFNADGTKFYAIDYQSGSGDIYQYTSTSTVGTDVTVYTCPAATAAKVKVSMQGEFGQFKIDDNTIIEIPSKSGVYHTQDTHKAASSGTVIFSPAGGNSAFLDEFNDYFQLEATETIKVTDARSMDYSIQIIEDSDGS